jgi:hypothetical protein
MNYIRIFTLPLLLIFSITNIQAQIKFGPKAGLNLSKMTVKVAGIDTQPETLAGFHVGVISEIPVKGNFVLQPSFIYSGKGSKYSYNGIEVSISPGFLEIPVNAAWKFNLGIIKLYLDAGPYFAYGIAGKIKYGEQSQAINFGSGDDSVMRPFDTGLNFGAGLDIKNILISFNYELSLLNLVPVQHGNYEAEVRSRVIGISVAYLFGME